MEEISIQKGEKMVKGSVVHLAIYNLGYFYFPCLKNWSNRVVTVLFP